MVILSAWLLGLQLWCGSLLQHPRDRSRPRQLETHLYYCLPALASPAAAIATPLAALAALAAAIAAVAAIAATAARVTARVGHHRLGRL